MVNLLRVKVTPAPGLCVASVTLALAFSLCSAPAHAADLRTDALICMRDYTDVLNADTRFGAEHRAAIEARRAALESTYAINRPALAPSSRRIGDLSAGLLVATLRNCEDSFSTLPAFQPRIHATVGGLTSPAGSPAPAAAAPAPGQTAPIWEFVGEAGGTLAQPMRSWRATIRGVRSGETLILDCMARDGMLPARVTFEAAMSSDAQVTGEHGDLLQMTVRTGGNEFVLDGQLRRSQPLGTSVQSRWVFADRSMPAAEALQAADDPIEIEAAGQRLVFSSEGAGPALEHMLIACGARQISDMICASAYWLHGAFNPEVGEAALARADHAVDRHLQSHAGQQRLAIEQQVMARGEAWGLRIQNGEESAAGLNSDLVACERKYGFAQGGR